MNCAMKLTTIEQELRDNGRCMVQTVGISMEPLLHNRYSTVVLEPLHAPLKRDDVVLFQRRVNGQLSGDYVLHRVITVQEDAYIIRGDNCMQNETVVPAQIIGVMIGYFNGDSYVDCATDAAYRRYVKTLRWRYARRWCRALPGRALRKLKRCIGR